jgi:hypothetical protein
MDAKVALAGALQSLEEAGACLASANKDKMGKNQRKALDAVIDAATKGKKLLKAFDAGRPTDIGDEITIQKDLSNAIKAAKKLGPDVFPPQ